MAVNAAVLIADTRNGSALGLYRVLRKRFPLLAATSGTTIAGALPFLFLARSSASVVRSLSLVSAFGVAASVLCSISLIPALAARFPRLFAQSAFSAQSGDSMRGVDSYTPME
jgi:multidrug efflux pump subunit AcrB